MNVSRKKERCDKSGEGFVEHWAGPVIWAVACDLSHPTGEGNVIYIHKWWKGTEKLRQQATYVLLGSNVREFEQNLSENRNKCSHVFNTKKCRSSLHDACGIRYNGTYSVTMTDKKMHNHIYCIYCIYCNNCDTSKEMNILSQQIEECDEIEKKQKRAPRQGIKVQDAESPERPPCAARTLRGGKPKQPWKHRVQGIPPAAASLLFWLCKPSNHWPGKRGQAVVGRKAQGKETQSRRLEAKDSPATSWLNVTRLMSADEEKCVYST